MRKTRSAPDGRARNQQADAAAWRPRASGPAGAAANPPALGSTLAEACGYLLGLGCLDLSPATVKCYRQHAGHLVRIYGALPIRSWTLAHGQTYIAQRLEEGASRSSVRLELVVLRRALELAKQHGRIASVADLVPRFKVEYRPRRRWLTEADFERLLISLDAGRRRWLLLATYVGLRSSEIERCAWDGVDLANGWLAVPGTKTKGAHRRVPMHARLRADLAQHEGPRTGPLCEPWRNVRRTLARHCAKLGLERCSPNDLRRTFASWLKQRHVDSMVVAQLLGHSSTRMVELVYGRLDTRTLEAAVQMLPDSAGRPSDKPEPT